jgi:hypothetical protein
MVIYKDFTLLANICDYLFHECVGSVHKIKFEVP